MSLIKTVVAMVRERGTATVDDLTPLLPQYTRKQVLQALQNGVHEGWLACKLGKGLGTGRGRAPGIFRVADGLRKVPERKPARQRRQHKGFPRVASVFHLGAALAANDSQRARA